MASKVVFRTPYADSYEDPGLRCEDPSLAQQQFKDEVDINVLLERFKVTGRMPESVRLPSYGDFTAVSDYRSALDAVNQARDAFMELPAKVRAEFNHSPQAFLEFVSDEKNLPRMRELGLANAAKQVAAVAAGGGTPPEAAEPPAPSKAQ